MAPFIHFLIDFDGLGTARMLRDDNLGATFVENCDDRVAVERFIPEQRTEIYSFDQRLNANGFEALSWQQPWHIPCPAHLKRRRKDARKHQLCPNRGNARTHCSTFRSSSESGTVC